MRHALFLLSSAGLTLLLGLSSSLAFLAMGFDSDDRGSETVSTQRNLHMLCG